MTTIKQLNKEFELDFGSIAKNIWGYPFPLTKMVKLQERIIEINNKKLLQVVDEMIERLEGLNRERIKEIESTEVQFLSTSNMFNNEQQLDGEISEDAGYFSALRNSIKELIQYKEQLIL